MGCVYSDFFFDFFFFFFKFLTHLRAPGKREFQLRYFPGQTGLCSHVCEGLPGLMIGTEGSSPLWAAHPEAGAPGLYEKTNSVSQ